ncbi:oligosaccharide flippase family protein [Sphingomonas yunnanensis]|uniref:lipopolysaccharide biosynthesis protein n=1 Tax=Sphingomonas yunnanensis TaxID=310400 RepID=UPI001CA67CCB|nr:oligosaccharide flippase family protein [Sphingomonas yunnanensis]MBY9064154.1 oligosaccharide flippase family protein [Sphingomonas yunnanensis]
MTIAIPAKLISLFTVGIRGAGLAMRFLLSFYIIKFLGYEAAGVYGLSLGAIGLSPAILGFGLNYFLARDVVGVEPAEAGVRIKTRLTVTAIALLVATTATLVGTLALGHELKPIYVLITLLVWFETFSNDINVSLIASEMPFQANVLIFVRMAIWVPFVIVAGLVVPSLRSIEVVFIGWIVAYVVYAALLFYFVRGWPLSRILHAPLEYSWIRERAKQTWFIYLSDLGMVGSMYVDRYVVSFLLGLKQVGLYTFYWSLTNALQTLVGTAVAQLALPALYKAFRVGSVAGWSEEMRRQMLKVAGFAGVLAVLIYAASQVIFRFMSMAEVAEHSGVFLMLLTATVIRCTSDVFNIGLMSAHKDRHYGLINMGGVILSVVVTYSSIKLFGFVGTGIGAIVTAVILASVRGSILWRFATTAPSPRPAMPS